MSTSRQGERRSRYTIYSLRLNCSLTIRNKKKQADK
nr:MAG TPA: hypothetical protein [Caudoviricetes sp.]